MNDVHADLRRALAAAEENRHQAQAEAAQRQFEAHIRALNAAVAGMRSGWWRDGWQEGWREVQRTRAVACLVQTVARHGDLSAAQLAAYRARLEKDETPLPDVGRLGDLFAARLPEPVRAQVVRTFVDGGPPPPDAAPAAKGQTEAGRQELEAHVQVLDQAIADMRQADRQEGRRQMAIQSLVATVARHGDLSAAQLAAYRARLEAAAHDLPDAVRLGEHFAACLPGPVRAQVVRTFVDTDLRPPAAAAAEKGRPAQAEAAPREGKAPSGALDAAVASMRQADWQEGWQEGWQEVQRERAVACLVRTVARHGDLSAAQLAAYHARLEKDDTPLPDVGRLGDLFAARLPGPVRAQVVRTFVDGGRRETTDSPPDDPPETARDTA